MFSLVMPFHSDVDRLLETISVYRSGFNDNQIKEILLCHNGSPLSPESRKKVGSIEDDLIKYLHTDSKGLGAGYRVGLKAASQPYIVLSASDLPFGFSDIENFIKLSDRPLVAIGSKYHPKSNISNYPASRLFVSNIFRICRSLILFGNTPSDSQGTIIIQRECALELEPLCSSNDYFFSTEISSYAILRKLKLVEVPITLFPRNDSYSSSVNIVSDSIILFRKLFELRSKLRKNR